MNEKICECELENKYEYAKRMCQFDYEMLPETNKHLLIAIEAIEKQQRIKECLEWLKTLDKDEKLIVREVIEVIEGFVAEGKE